METKVYLDKTLIEQGMENLYDEKNCIGALALRKTIKEAKFVQWGDTFGYTSDVGGRRGETHKSARYFRSIDSQGEIVHVMDIKEPTEIILKELTRKEYNNIVLGLNY